MAKSSKKSETKEEAKPKAAKQPAAAAAKSASPASAGGSAAKSAPKKPAAKSDSKPRPNLMSGGIDTNLAASAAASLLFAKRKGRDQLSGSASIDQIKNDLAKPASAVAGDMLDQSAGTTGASRSNLPIGGQSRNSQTVGHAAERTFVPRRTGG